MEELRKGRIKMKDIMPEQEWETSGVTCLAARPAMGKTSLALDFMLDAALWMKKPILWFSLSMLEIQMALRIISNVSGILEKMSVDDEGRLSSRDMEKLRAVAGFMKGERIFIDDTPGISVSEVEEKVRNLKGVGMVIIDYVQLMQGDDAGKFASRKEEGQWIMKQLSRISKENQVPILVLSQLSRRVDDREDKRPCFDDMLHGITAETADQVIFLYRDGYYKKEEDEKKFPETEIIVAKSKSGKEKTVKAQFNWDGLYFEKSEG